jgi:hypothetical protein
VILERSKGFLEFVITCDSRWEQNFFMFKNFAMRLEREEKGGQIQVVVDAPERSFRCGVEGL